MGNGTYYYVTRDAAYPAGKLVAVFASRLDAVESLMLGARVYGKLRRHTIAGSVRVSVLGRNGKLTGQRFYVTPFMPDHRPPGLRGDSVELTI